MILFLLLLGTVASIIALLPEEQAAYNSGSIASELEIKESVNGNVTSTSYVDSKGVPVDAVDVGYATIQTTRNEEGKVTKELYFDAEGNPSMRYGGYYGVSYEYGESTVLLKYLDADQNNIKISSGYAAIERTVNSDGMALDEFYLDLDLDKTQCVYGYYGIHLDYDSNGQNSRVTYLDRSGQSICSTSGYAITTYQRDSEGVATAQYYFDANGNPVESSLGQYGEQYLRDENGRITQITYLDADGNPAPTNAGYAIQKRIYYHDGTVDTEMYFDADGNPMALSKGQYGIKHSEKTTLLLNKNGRVMLCVDNILNAFPFMVVISGCMICILLILLPRKASIFLTIAYVLFILYETMMFREAGDARANFVLFSYAYRFFTEQSVRIGVINNIWLFVPLGTGLYRNIQKKWVLLIPFLLSVAIEATQYITGLGIAEFDDVFGNTMGGWIGVLAAYTSFKYPECSFAIIKRKTG